MVYKYICVSVDNCNKTPIKIGPTHHTVIVLNKRKIYLWFPDKSYFVFEEHHLKVGNLQLFSFRKFLCVAKRIVVKKVTYL